MIRGEDLSYVSVDFTEAVSLSSEQVEGAASLSQQVYPLRQWQTYLNGLAWAGIQNWFRYRAPTLALETQESVLESVSLLNFVPAVGPIRVNQFSVSIIATALFDDVLLLPKAVLDIPVLSSHFYCWVEVHEEAHETRMAGVLRHDQMQALCPSLTETPHWEYIVPTEAFTEDMDSFLRLLFCGTPEMIPLSWPTARDTLKTQTIESLGRSLNRLGALAQAPWDILTWEEAQALLETPSLSHWLKVDWPSAAIAQRQVQRCLTRLQMPVLNAAQWVEDRLDDMSQLWGPDPQLLPSGLRSSPSPVTQIFEGLGIQFHSQARVRMREIPAPESPLQLYAIAQPEPLQYGLPHWSLFFLLTSASPLPLEVQLHVTDGAALNQSQAVNQADPERYLFIHVMGLWTERFWVSIDLPNSSTLELEPFAWQPQ